MSKLNIIDENGKIIGEDTRKNIHKNGLLHREINVYFYTPQGEIIFQHRSKNKETFPDLLERSEKLIKKIEERHPNKKVLFVSHGDIGKMIYAKFYDLPWKDVLSDFHFGNTEILHLSRSIDPKDARIYVAVQHNH